MNSKALARFLYANVPGVAVARFAAKDLIATRLAKPEFGGVSCLSIRDGLIVDVGANRGQSIFAFKRLAPSSKIIAFEPEPRSAKRLAARYAGDSVVAIQACALGSQLGQMTFYVPTYGWWNCDGMAATDRSAATAWLSDPGRMYRFDRAKLSVTEHIVECRTLDSFGLAPMLIKLHAQGAELDILNGARETIRRNRPALMCAFPTAEVTDFLAGLGYQPFVYAQASFTPGIAMRPVTFTWFLAASHRHQVPIGTV